MCLPDAPTADPPLDARRTPGPVEVGQAKFSLEHLDPMAASGAGECPARTSVCAVDRAACPRAAHLAADSARGSRTRVYCSGAAPVAWGPADLRPWPADLHAFERIRVPRVEPRPRPRIFALVRGPAPLSRGPATLPMEPYARLGTLTLTPAEPLPCLWSRTLASGFASLCPLRGAAACCAVLPRAVRCVRLLCGASVCCAVRPSAVPCVRLLCRASACYAVRPLAAPRVRLLRHPFALRAALLARGPARSVRESRHPYAERAFCRRTATLVGRRSPVMRSEHDDEGHRAATAQQALAIQPVEATHRS